MKVLKGIGVVFLVLAAVSCLPEQEVRVYSSSYSFLDSASSWTGGFADFAEDTTGYRLHFGLNTLAYKVNADSSKKALRISGFNKSDSLFMYIKRRISGLRPNTEYQLLFNVKLASKEKLGTTDGLGAPGENVYVKAGGSTFEPETTLIDGVYRMNIDIGNPDEDGGNTVVIGHVGVATTTVDYALITRNNSMLNAAYASTDSQGQLWIIVGTHSTFKGETTLYYTQVDVLFNQVD